MKRALPYFSGSPRRPMGGAGASRALAGAAQPFCCGKIRSCLAPAI
jgi:hypothetical protein